MTRTTIPNLTLFSGIKIILKSSLYIKTLDRFQDNVRFSVFEHILNLNHCRVFETNPTFPSIILNSDQNFFELENDKGIEFLPQIPIL